MRQGRVPVARLPLLPVTAVVAGCLGLAVQLALPRQTRLPEIGQPKVRAVQPPVRVYVADAADPQIGTNTLFAPSRTLYAPATGATGVVPADRFEGAMLIGIARSRNFAVAVVKQAGGAVSSIRPGAALGGWRLLRVGAASAVFASGGVVRTLIVGETAKVQPATTQETTEVPS